MGINNLLTKLNNIIKYIVYCYIVTRSTWLLVSRKYKDAMFLKHEETEAEAEIEAERQLWKDVGQE